MLSVGLVGLPNAGKSTLFNLLTRRAVPAENFPFTTIDPHDGIVEVPDRRVDMLAEMASSEKTIKAAIEFRDIAGLIKNASHGAGLGNQFLSHIREVDLILMVVRGYEDKNIIHVEDRVNPQEDHDILMLELTAADSSNLDKQIVRIEKELKSSNDPLTSLKLETIEKIQTLLSEFRPASEYVYDTDVDSDLIKWRKSLNLLTDKPILKLANIKQDGTNIEWSNADFRLDILMEFEATDFSTDERKEFGMPELSGLDSLIKECYEKLDLQTFLTVGPKEARAWTFSRGMTAPQCAGKIHTDFEKTFIKAEVVSFEDMMSIGGWKGAVESGKVRSMGKDYIMKDGDIVEFKTGA
jgi:hypothetical protein